MTSRREFLAAGVALAGVGAASAYSRATVHGAGAIGVGIIGVGDRGRGLARILTNHAAADVVALCDVLPFRLEAGLEATGPGTETRTDYRYLLDDPGIEAVIIATPFHFHAQPFVDALDAGKHVYVEKTAFKGYRQIAAAEAAAAGSDRIIQVGYQYRHSRLYEHVAERLRSGDIGQVSRIECQWNRNGNWRRPVPSPELERAINWRMYREYSGGLVAELSSHQMDACNLFLDSTPVSIMGSGGVDFWKDGRETRDNTHVLVSYGNGVDVSFSCLTNNAHNGYLIRIFGSKGTILLNRDEAWIVREQLAGKEFGEVDAVSGATIVVDNAPATKIEFEHLGATEQAISDFVNSLHTGDAPRSGIRNGLLGAAMVQDSLDAMDSGEVQHFDWS